MKTLSEQEYIAQLKKGSQEAFDHLYQMYAKRLYAFSYQYTKSHQDTEEIIQDVFVKLWLNREAIRQEETLKHLLFIMAKNQLINSYRARINSPIFEEYVNYTNKRRIAINDTMNQILYEDFLNLIDKAKLSLSDIQQKIFEMSKVEQFSHDEIAQSLSISKQTVKNQLSISLKILRSQLDKHLQWLIIFLFC